MQKVLQYFPIIFGVLFPFVHSSQTMDAVLVPRWLALSGVIIGLSAIGYFQLKKTSKIHLNGSSLTWGVGLFLVAGWLVNPIIAVNPDESFFYGYKWAVGFLSMFVLFSVFQEEGLKQYLVKGLIVFGGIHGGLGLLLWAGYSPISAFLPSNHVVGFMANENLLASLLVMLFPLGFVGSSFQKKWQIISWVSLSLMLGALLLSLSKAAIVISVILMGLVVFYFLKSSASKKVTTGVFLAVIALLIGGWYYIKATDPVLYSRMISINTLQTRFHLWDNTWQMIKAFPVLGVGFGCWKLMLPLFGLGDFPSIVYTGSTSYVRAHNQLLEVFAEAGVVFGMVFLVFLLLVFSAGIKSIVERKNTIIAMSFIGLLGGVLLATFDFPFERASHLWVFANYGFILLSASSAKQSVSKKWLMVPIGVCLFFGVVSFNRIEGEKRSKQLHGHYVQQNLRGLTAVSNTPKPSFYSIDPTVVPVGYFKGMAAFVSKDYQGAKKAFSSALNNHPNHMLTHNNLGATYKQLGQPDKATELYKKVLEISPKYNRAKWNLIESYIHSDSLALAIEQFEKLPKGQNEREYNYLLEGITTTAFKKALNEYPFLKEDEKYMRTMSQPEFRKKMYFDPLRISNGTSFYRWILPFNPDTLSFHLKD